VSRLLEHEPSIKEAVGYMFGALLLGILVHPFLKGVTMGDVITCIGIVLFFFFVLFLASFALIASRFKRFAENCTFILVVISARLLPVTIGFFVGLAIA